MNPSVEPAIPEGQLAEECHVACEGRTWKEIQLRLRSDAPKEACVFVLTEPSRGVTRATTILRKPIWPAADEVVATPYSLEISADYIARVTDAAIDEGDQTGVALVHTHPGTEFGNGVGVFSSRDDWYEMRLFPTLLNGRPLTLGASVVLGTKPDDLDARLWWNGANGLQSQAVQVLRIVGPETTFIETPHSPWIDHTDPVLMDRSTRLWGKAGRRLLQNVRVGVVGAGGTGSIALVALATMGTGKLRAWDGDVLKKQNLHRTLGATLGQVGANKVRALHDTILASATADPFV
jgi:hypothetical protein